MQEPTFSPGGLKKGRAAQAEKRNTVITKQISKFDVFILFLSCRLNCVFNNIYLTKRSGILFHFFLNGAFFTNERTAVSNSFNKLQIAENLKLIVFKFFSCKIANFDYKLKILFSFTLKFGIISIIRCNYEYIKKSYKLIYRCERGILWHAVLIK